MATIIGFFAGEGSNPRELSYNKELVVIDGDEFSAPIVMLENLARKFSEQKYPDKPLSEEEIEEAAQWMVLVAIISDGGDVKPGEQWINEYNAYD